MKSNRIISRLFALCLVVTLTVIGMPVLASAAGDDDPVPARRLTTQGQPLSQFLTTTAVGDQLRVILLSDGALLLNPSPESPRQDQAGQAQDEGEPGWWGRRSKGEKVAIGVGIGVGAALLVLVAVACGIGRRLASSSQRLSE